MRTPTIHITLLLAAMLGLGRAVIAQDDNGPADDVLMRWNVAVVVYQGVELLDFAGPGEVFAAAAHRNMRGDEPWFDVYTVGPGPEPVVSQGFVTIVPQFSIDDAPAPDIIVIPGGAAGVLRRDERFMRWMESSLPHARVALSVCTGAFVLADLDLLDGKVITTHWGALEALQRATEDATVRDDVRFVDNDTVVTTAGVSAGIDGALHVVARLLGYDHAVQTARYMQYEWAPDDVQVAAYSRYNPRLDPAARVLAEAAALREAGRVEQAIAAYRGITEEDPANGEAWYYLGLLLHGRGDLDAALPAHLQAAEHDSGRFGQNGLYNAACVRALKGRPDEALVLLERCAAAGSINAQWALQDGDLASIREDPRFKAAIARMWINAARAQMRAENEELALAALRQAAALGYGDFDALLDDPDFRRLEALPGSRELGQD